MAEQETENMIQKKCGGCDAGVWVDKRYRGDQYRAWCPECRTISKITSAVDPVTRPSHYTSGRHGIETIEVMENSVEDPASVYQAQVLKYVARAGKKGDKVEDLKKARQYLNRWINYETDGSFSWETRE